MVVPIQFHPDHRMLRQFSAALAVVAGGIALYLGGTGRLPWDSGWILLLGGLVLEALVALVAIRVLAPLQRALFIGVSLVTWPLGFLIGWVLLAALFFGMIAPFGLFFRAIGRRRMPLGRGGAGSLWTERPPPRPAASYLRQF